MRPTLGLACIVAVRLLEATTDSIYRGRSRRSTIDGEFVSSCLANKTDQLVIEAVVRIARGLGEETIAEFVSDPQLEAFVRSQGFHVGRPVPVSELGLGAARRRRRARVS